LKAALEKAFPGIDVEMIKSRGGAFEIRRDHTLIFSKTNTGRFPSNDEIIGALS
jgi:selT/selW/selH-like putative selenoprotein